MLHWGTPDSSEDVSLQLFNLFCRQRTLKGKIQGVFTNSRTRVSWSHVSYWMGVNFRSRFGVLQQLGVAIPGVPAPPAWAAH
jgi:hypothetical protein